MNMDRLEVYRLLVCTNVLTDVQTGAPSYIGVLSAFTVARELLGKPVPFTVNMDGVGRGSYEVCLVWLDEHGATTKAGEPTSIEVPGGHLSFRAPVFQLPPAPGLYNLTVEYRSGSDESWKRTSGRCPIEFRLADEAPSTPRTSGELQ